LAALPHMWMPGRGRVHVATVWQPDRQAAGPTCSVCFTPSRLSSRILCSLPGACTAMPGIDGATAEEEGAAPPPLCVGGCSMLLLLLLLPLLTSAAPC
jgi:hypothetical protein